MGAVRACEAPKDDTNAEPALHGPVVGRSIR